MTLKSKCVYILDFLDNLFDHFLYLVNRAKLYFCYDIYGICINCFNNLNLQSVLPKNVINHLYGIIINQ